MMQGTASDYSIKHLERGRGIVMVDPVHGKWSSQQGIEALLHSYHQKLPWLDTSCDFRTQKTHMVEFGTHTIVKQYLSVS